MKTVFNHQQYKEFIIYDLYNFYNLQTRKKKWPTSIQLFRETNSFLFHKLKTIMNF